ncbi:MAG: segregation/condensation protein A [Planctomycetota bacterium]|jgi:segregation and condensation protein A|nr:segregation/condensation protein A [Planctomycetota bacterium]
MSLNVQIPDTFSGPLDLLLHLIRRDEMDIHDIPIAQLTSAYMEEIEKLELVDVDEASEFLDLASRLAEIKSRMLLPEEERDDAGEDIDDPDPRAGLVRALLEYRRFKEAAELLRGLAEEQARRYPRIAPPPALDIAEEPVERLDSSDLFEAFQALLFRLVPADGADAVHYQRKFPPVTVRIKQIENVLASAGKTRFSLLLSGKPTREEMVGFFIAMLELIRRGKVAARQGGPYGDIVIEARTPGVGESVEGGRAGGRAARRRVARGRGAGKAGAAFPRAVVYRPPPSVQARRPPPAFPSGGRYGFNATPVGTSPPPVFFSPCRAR